MFKRFLVAREQHSNRYQRKDKSLHIMAVKLWVFLVLPYKVSCLGLAANQAHLVALLSFAVGQRNIKIFPLN